MQIRSRTPHFWGKRYFLEDIKIRRKLLSVHIHISLNSDEEKKKKNNDKDNISKDLIKISEYIKYYEQNIKIHISYIDRRYKVNFN